MNKLFINHSVGEIIEKMEKKKISPKEVIAASLNNIKELNKKYIPWVAYGNEKLFEKERKENQIFDKGQRLLWNIPVGIKDIFNTADFPTQMGSPIWKGFTPGNDARTVFNLKRQGAVVMGKTVTAEFAVHTPGKTLNPYDVTKTTGTSSSGSAVAIALGMVPVATGTQTAGSIVRPASFCGVYGCKPSFGTIPRTGTLKTTDSLDTIGFFALHQKDLVRMFDSMRVKGRNYPISNAALTDPKRQVKSKNRPWKIAFARTHTWDHAPEYAKSAIENFLKRIDKNKGFRVIEANLPKEMTRTHDVHKTIYDKCLSYYFRDEYKLTDFVSPIMRELITNGSRIKITDYMKAITDQNILIRKMDSFFRNYDILISLSTAGEAPDRDVVEKPDPALMWTLTHLPVVSVPQFKSPSGLPFGMQIASRKYNDYLLFSFLDELRKKGIIPEKSSFFE